MIKIQNLSLYQGTELLIENSQAFVAQGQKVGILGANGSGKTTLFKALLGQVDVQGGEIHVPSHLKIAHIEQTIPSLDETAILYVMRANSTCHQIYQQLLRAEENQDAEQLASLYAELADQNGYYFKAQAEKVLHGLGFKQSQLTHSVAEFSGGWRMRLHLARCLLMDADLLLLDEPTNHLDLNGILWLQNWLSQYNGTLLLISHDRDFLDQIVTHILHLEHHRLQMYTGNYSSFTQQYAEMLAQHEAQYRKQQQQIKHMMSYVNRFRYKASKAKQAQSRLKAIERIEKIPPLLADYDFSFNFQQPEPISNPLITISNAAIGYQDQVLLKNINLSIENHSRIGLLGANGAGKSTFLRALTQALTPSSGEILFHNKLNIGYFSQHQVESFSPESSCLTVMQAVAPQLREQQLRSYLGLFGFSSDKALRTTENLSGGEKARLALAKIFWQRPHLLLLDEPTNHLDLLMRNALTLALEAYQGAIVLVSHDRFLLRSIVDELWLVNEGTVSVFSGDLDDYTQLLMKKDSAADLSQALSSSKTLPAAKKISGQILRRLNEIEKLIKKLSINLENIDAKIVTLSHTNLNDDAARSQLAEQNQQRLQLLQRIEQLEDEWYRLQE